MDAYDFAKDVGGLIVTEMVAAAAYLSGDDAVLNMALDDMRSGALDAAASTAGLVSPAPGVGKGIKATAAVAKVAGASAEANKIGHIFNKAEHNLGALSKNMGGDAKAFKAIEGATSKAVDVSKPGRFEVAVNVGGEKVTVRGSVVDGAAKIGTAFIKNDDLKK